MQRREKELCLFPWITHVYTSRFLFHPNYFRMLQDHLAGFYHILGYSLGFLTNHLIFTVHFVLITYHRVFLLIRSLELLPGATCLYLLTSFVHGSKGNEMFRRLRKKPLFIQAARFRLWLIS